ncbi:MAG: RrF2 family transcriptional regulator [bacterium]
MLRLTKKSEYGVIALKHMMNLPVGTVTRAKEVAELYNIPSEIMAKILQKLARRGIVQSSQGAKGGYILAKEGNLISLSEIIETIDGPVWLVECMTDDDCNCMQLDSCNISDPFRVIHKQFKIFLSKISLADINNEIEMQRVVWH